MCVLSPGRDKYDCQSIAECKPQYWQILEHAIEGQVADLTLFIIIFKRLLKSLDISHYALEMFML